MLPMAFFFSLMPLSFSLSFEAAFDAAFAAFDAAAFAISMMMPKTRYAR